MVASSSLLLYLLKEHHGHFMDLFYRVYCVAVTGTRYCQ